MQDKYTKRRKWMWFFLLTPLFVIVIGITFSMIVGVLSSDCPVMMGDKVISIPGLSGGGVQGEPSEYCKTLRHLGTNVGPRISFVGVTILFPALFIGAVLFFMSRRPKPKDPINIS